jgi:hypothetical protein
MRASVPSGTIDVAGDALTQQERAWVLFGACWAGDIAGCRYLWDDDGKLRSAGGGDYLTKAAARSGKKKFYLWLACRKGRINVAQWLLHNRIVDDLCGLKIAGGSLLWIAALKGHQFMLPWLVINGAANHCTWGHVDERLLRRDLRGEGVKERLVAELDPTIRMSAVFSGVVLLATRSGASPLSRLRGLERTVLRDIADFAGVLRGRCLRNAREASECLLKEVHEGAILHTAQV